MSEVDLHTAPDATELLIWAKVNRWIYNPCQVCGQDIGLERHVHRLLRANGESPVPGMRGWWGFWHARCYAEQRQRLTLRMMHACLAAIRAILGKPAPDTAPTGKGESDAQM